MSTNLGDTRKLALNMGDDILLESCNLWEKDIQKLKQAFRIYKKYQIAALNVAEQFEPNQPPKERRENLRLYRHFRDRVNQMKDYIERF